MLSLVLATKEQQDSGFSNATLIGEQLVQRLD